MPEERSTARVKVVMPQMYRLAMATVPLSPILWGAPWREDVVTDVSRSLRICGLMCGLTVALCAHPAVAQSPSGGEHDFDFEIGTWKTRLSRLMRPLTSSTEWARYEGT